MLAGNVRLSIHLSVRFPVCIVSALCSCYFSVTHAQTFNCCGLRALINDWPWCKAREYQLSPVQRPGSCSNQCCILSSLDWTRHRCKIWLLQQHHLPDQLLQFQAKERDNNTVNRSNQWIMSRKAVPVNISLPWEKFGNTSPSVWKNKEKLYFGKPINSSKKSKSSKKSLCKQQICS